MPTLLEPDQRDTIQTTQVAGLAPRLPSPVRSDAASEALDVTLRINGAEHRLQLDPRTTLLDALREHLGLTGTKKGCDLGQCGACTVLVDGRRINACLTLAVIQQGKEITTIEGLARDGALHPMQAAFVEHDGFQCGYCTPGQIMSAVGLLAEGRAHSDAEIREFMSGNICRCGAYSKIVAAIRSVAAQGRLTHAALRLHSRAERAGRHCRRDGRGRRRVHRRRHRPDAADEGGRGRAVPSGRYQRPALHRDHGRTRRAAARSAGTDERRRR